MPRVEANCADCGVDHDSREPHVPELHDTEYAQEAISVGGAGVIEGDSDVDDVTDKDRDIDGVFDGDVEELGVTVRVWESVGDADLELEELGVTVRVWEIVGDADLEFDEVDDTVTEIVGVPEAETPVVSEEVGVDENEHETYSERPVMSQQEQGIGNVDANGQ